MRHVAGAGRSPVPVVRLRFIAQVNPPTPEFDLLGDGEALTFLPLEAIWSGAGLDTSRVRSKAEVSAGYTRFQAGDILIPKITPTFQANRSVIAAGLLGRLGAGTTELHVVRPGALVDARYLLHTLSARTFLREGEGSMVGVAGQKRVPDEFLRDYPVRLPALPEQLAIADYLDAEAVRIDGLADLRARIMGLLAERRRLATDRMLSDVSGGHAWPVVKLKHVVKGFVDTLHATAPGEQDGPGYIVGTACIKSGSLNVNFARRCSIETIREWTKRALPRAGDVLLTREAPAGEAALVPAGIQLAPGQRVVLVQTDRHLMLPELVLHSIYSARAGRFFDLLGRETTVAHLNMADIGELPIVLPPLDVQPVVAARIGAELASLDRASSAMSRQIDLLLERRQALITAAVTGQIDIPGVAA